MLVGADAVIPGGVVNKVGTHMMALAAKELGIPVYCLTESTKIWPFDEPIIKSISTEQSTPLSGSGMFEMIPGSIFDAIVLESGPVAFDKISINREDIKIAPEIRKLVGL
jgi:translation initiation factor 2B subunit (eIF-2B alpha/beta/delta family)